MRNLYRNLFMAILWLFASGVLIAQTEQESRIPAQKRRLQVQFEEALKSNALYNESIFLIYDYSNGHGKTSIPALLHKGIEGFYFYLRQNSGNQLAIREPDGSFYPFKKALAGIKEALEEDENKIITLFLDFVVDIELEPILREAGLFDYILEYDSNRGWPFLREIVVNNKRLILFETQKHINSPGWLHELNEHVWGTPGQTTNEKPLSFEEKADKELSVFTRYMMRGLPVVNTEELTNYARQTPHLIELFRKHWLNEGRVPNFIWMDRDFDWSLDVLHNVRSFHMVLGLVTDNNELVNYVNWNGLNNYTSGKFNFPIEPGNTITLTPSVPGYDIHPRSQTIQASSKKIYPPEFKAKRIEIDRDLEVYLPFDNHADNLSWGAHKSKAEQVDYIFDPKRGQVASLNNESRISLSTADALGIQNHDFTVAAWVKIPRFSPDKRDHCILGTTNNSYQQGLHLLIRDNKPYMGFFNNDLQGNTTIEPGSWYHIVYRYNKMNGEQAIFVNGKLDAISFDRPPYFGKDSIYAGFTGFNVNGGLNGMMDNLAIWSRTLNENEILGISNQLIKIEVPSRWEKLVKRNRTAMLLGTIPVLLLVVSVLILTYRKIKPKRPAPKRKESKPKTPVLTPVTQLPEMNCIRLFGNFTVIDKDGKNITALFTPKIKQLFLVILCHSCKDHSGISSSELTEIVWNDSSHKNTKSLRSVSILKLRKILEQMDSAEVLFQGNRYAITLNESVWCDYIALIHLFNEGPLGPERTAELLEIIGRGEFCKGETEEWLDEYKGDVSNLIIDFLSKHIDEYASSNNPGAILKYMDQILLYDPVNEEALTWKIKALIKQNNLKTARSTYERFCSLYKDMYGENYTISFREIAN